MFRILRLICLLLGLPLLPLEGTAAAKALLGMDSTAQDVVAEYGFRYYAPVVGRWTARDPIEERGGVNIYAMVRNDLLNMSDFIGLAYKTMDAAGKAASQLAYEKTKEWSDDPNNLVWVRKGKGLEYWGYVCSCSCGDFDFTNPEPGVHPSRLPNPGPSGQTGDISKDDGNKKCSKIKGVGWKVVGWYHSHPITDFGGFSPADAKVTVEQDLPAYLGDAPLTGRAKVTKLIPNNHPVKKFKSYLDFTKESKVKNNIEKEWIEWSKCQIK